MAHPIQLPQGRRWHGPAPWKVAVVLVGLIGISAAMLYYGRDLLGHVLPKRAPVTRPTSGEALRADTFVKASSNGVPPGAPIDPEILKREVALRKTLADAQAMNERIMARLEALDTRPAKTSIQGVTSTPDGPPEKASKPSSKAAPKPSKIQVKPPDSLVYVAYTPPEHPISETGLTAGTVVNCTLKTAINSERQTVVVAEVREHIRDSRNPDLILMPQFSKMILDTDPAQLIAGEERVDLALARIELPNRQTIELPKEPVVDQIGQGGLTGEVDRKWRYVIPALLFRGVFAASVEQVTHIGVSGLNGMQSAGSQIGQKISQPYLQVRPTIRIPEGERCAVILTKHLDLPAYHF